MAAPVEVAVAVLFRTDGCVLLARRPVGKVYAGYWEFPGGKMEPGETVQQALARELREELAIEVEHSYPWITRNHSYPHANVRLHFRRVIGWHGEPRTLEHDALSWERPDLVGVSPVLPANGPVFSALMLPQEYAISQATELGVKGFLDRLSARLEEGLRLVQVREPGMAYPDLSSLVSSVIRLARPAGARVLVNGDIGLAREAGADGVHLSARQVAVADRRPDLPLVGASAHSAGELRAAERIGADFAVLGPVRSTPSHPDRAPLGWNGLRESGRGSGIPVYALGGMNRGDMSAAWDCGAHGVAMVRGAWRET